MSKYRLNHDHCYGKFIMFTRPHKSLCFTGVHITIDIIPRGYNIYDITQVHVVRYHILLMQYYIIHQ